LRAFRTRFRNREYQLTSTAFGSPGDPRSRSCGDDKSAIERNQALTLEDDRLTAFGVFEQSYYQNRRHSRDPAIAPHH